MCIAFRQFVFLACCWTLSLAGSVEYARGEDGVEFFERKIRPVLVDRCYSCHSAAAAAKKTLKGGLRLDTRQGVRKGGDSGPAVVPGKPADSLLIAAIRHDSIKMPPREKLSDRVVADFVKWVQMGSPDPRDGRTSTGGAIELANARKMWVFQTPQLPPSPRLTNNQWPRGSIDRLILARLESRGMTPARAADRRTLIRRAAYDLLGLPPTANEIAEFVADSRPGAFKRVVDRLLESPDFGIRWARHWLDNVRYSQDDPTCAANSNGTFSIGPYRDWVVKALNRDLPYDQFVRLQVAGDLIRSKDRQQINVDGLTATGVWGLAHLVEGNDKEKVVADFVDEQLDVLGRTFLGLTISCARCHDHKFDPISQADYYALAGIFYSSHIFQFKGKSARVRVRVQRRAFPNVARQRQLESAVKQIAGLESQIAALEEKYENALELRQVRRDLQDQRMLKAKNPNELARVARRIKLLSLKEANLVADQKKRGWDPNPPELKKHAKLKVQRANLAKKLAVYPLRMVMHEGPVPGTRHKRTGDIRLFVRGNHLAQGRRIPRSFPRVFATQRGKRKITGSGRLELAHWLTRPDHPLTARVMANRVWQHLFGRGIVATPSNFGRLGQRPTHPELIDYLAVRLVNNGWSIKSLIREIMLSRTYQQASRTTVKNLARDPGNRWFGRMNRKRLGAEALMDTLAWHSDRVTRTSRSAPPWKLALSQRALFDNFTRDQPPTTLDLFDGANPDLLVPRRADSTSAPQALFMLNNSVALDAATQLAGKAMWLTDEQTRISFLYQQVFGRPATAVEKRVAGRIVSDARKTRQKLAATDKKQHNLQTGPWVDLCVALICSNEFIYVD